MKNVFVFVVCGAKEHIDTFHFSLEYLKKYSQNEIWVLTDSSRNEISIVHDNIIDIETSESHNNHQASIYLKTGIYQFLPKGNIYCYLDTDVVALSPDVDDIFAHYHSPITFALDHCKVKKFSAYAVNCGCSEKWLKNRELFEKISDIYDKNKQIKSAEILLKQEQLKKCFSKMKDSLSLKLWTAIRYFSSFKKFKLNNQFFFDKRSREWIDRATNKVVLYETDIKSIERETGFRYNKWSQKWLNSVGNDIWQDECNHLVESILSTFDINVSDSDWQHWNGGVFLFDDDSYDFLSTWHMKTIAAFDFDEWKTRDQGTLIATVWEKQLQNHKTLSKKWNFIADYYKEGVDFDEKKGCFTDDYWKTKYQAAFVHVYHHWGDESWSLWQWIKKKVKDV